MTRAAARTVRPFTLDDAEAVTELFRECEARDIGQPLLVVADVVADWQRPSFDLMTDSRGVFEGDRLVAYADVHKGRRADVQVRPDARGRGLGGELMRWSWERARAYGSPLVGQTVVERNAAATALFRANGYEPLWTSWILALPEGAEIDAPRLPAGTRVRMFVPEQDDRATFQVVEDAFNEWPDREPSTFDDWAAVAIRRPGFEPWQMLLAEQDGRVVGACFLILTEDSCWVQQIAVAKEARGRGLARALLLAAFTEARARGARRCELSTDSRTGALSLYEHVGMRVQQSFVHWARWLAD